MNWFIQLVAKHDLPAEMFYKIANPRVLRELEQLKRKVRKERHIIDRQPLNHPVQLPSFTENEPEEIPEAQQKIASVSFSISDAGKISQPKTILHMTWPLIQWFYDNNISKDIFDPNPYTVQPDGIDDFDKYVGTINLYLKDGQDPKALVPYVNQAVKEQFEPLGIHARIREINKSKLTGGNAIRLDVVQNDTQHIERLPELNISNENFYQLSKLLGLHGDDSGLINANDLLARISMARGQEDLYTRDDEINKSPGGPTMIDFGLRPDQLMRYLDVLEQIANRALEMNNPTVVWS